MVERLGPGAAVLGRLLPELGAAEAGAPDQSNGDRYVLFEAVASLLAELVREEPAALFLDDVYWADASTCALIGHLGRHHDLGRLLISVAFRPAEAQRPDPLADVLGELRRERVVATLPLAGLDEESSMALAAQLAGETEAAGGLAAEVAGRSEGNPFFIEELVAHHLGQDGETAPLLPVGVVDVVERRLSRLPAEHRKVLVAAAVVGREFDVDVLASVADAGEETLVEAVEAAGDLQLVTEVPERAGRCTFAHALIRVALLDGRPARPGPLAPGGGPVPPSRSRPAGEGQPRGPGRG